MKINGRYKIITSKDGKKIKETDWIKNLIVINSNHGTDLIIQRLAGLTTYDLGIDEIQFGTGDTAPTNADTSLETMTVEDVLVASYTKTTSKVTFNFFIANADMPNDTYKELGLFCGGQMFSRSLITPTYTKSAGEDTTVEYEIEITN